MSPQQGWVLQEEVGPRLKASIPNAVHCVGAEDVPELIQDATALAARLMDNNERAGKKVTPGNVAFYTTRHVRSGRRSCGSSTTDVMAAGTQLAGRSRLESLDQIVAVDETTGGEPLLLHDVLSTDQVDPALAAARHLDWQAFWSSLSESEQAIIEAVAEGKTARDAGRALGASDGEIYRVKRQLVARVLEFMGDDILVEIVRPPQWPHCLEANRQRAACRYDRQAA